ncbi:MAG: prolyl-tRNA synthetase associated domain-containing protein [Granulosicoccus sp.]
MSHSDRPDPDSVLLKNGALAATPEEILDALEKHGVEHDTMTHEPLYTVEQARMVNYTEPGAHTKNLFLRNKKGRMFLLVVERDQRVDLRSLRDKLNIPGGQFAFASTERLGHYLGVVPGSVSPLAIYNDHDCAVQVLIQNTLLEHEWIYLHPCRNTHSTRLRTRDLLDTLSAWKHPVTALTLE